MGLNKRDKEIMKFVGSLQGFERKWTSDLIAISDNIRKYIEESGCSKEQFCADLKIPLNQYNNFINGNFNYNISQLATIGVLWTELKKSKVKVNLVDVVNQEKQDKQ